MSQLSINHNLSASRIANNLTNHYGKLATSTQRLSTGLRINSAADDAAGLAIREQMRAQVTALQQGMRNINDAISMVQTFDGALSVIDEKLIRMKELAEQAATGTYDSTQRQMINEEFLAMGDEINRIARATDFNGMKLLSDGVDPNNRIQVGTQTVHRATANTASANITTSATDKDGNPITGTTISPNVSNPASFNSFLPTQPDGAVQGDSGTISFTANIQRSATDVPENKGGTNFNYDLTITDVNAPALTNFDVVYDYNPNYDPNDPASVKGTWSVIDKATGNAFANQTANAVGATVNIMVPNGAGVNIVTLSMLTYDNKPITDLTDLHTLDAGNTTKLILTPGSDTYLRSYDVDPPIVTLSNVTGGTATYDPNTKTITATPTNGGAVSFVYDPASTVTSETISFNVHVEGTATTTEEPIWESTNRIRIHFGDMNDAAEDYYDIHMHDATLKGLGLDGDAGRVSIETQDKAQEALVTVNDAIVAKDKIRAEYGAMQNRLENTLTNITTQAENLKAAESRISDTEIATEMTEFVKCQILTQAAVAMLAQANSMPQMVTRLLGV